MLINTNTPFVKTYYIRAFTESARHMGERNYKGYNFVKVFTQICGSEQIAITPNKGELFYLYNKNTNNTGVANEQRLPHTTYSTTFTVNSEWCPIIGYQIFEKVNGVMQAYSGSDISLGTGLLGQQEIVISTSAPMTKTVYIRAYTERDIYAFSPAIKV